MHRSAAFIIPAIFLSASVIAAPAPVKVEVLQTKLDHPWSLAFLPGDQGMLITMRGGQLRQWQPGKGLSDPITGIPKVWANGQGGLLDVVLAPDFAKSRRVWLSYAEAGQDGKAGTVVGMAALAMMQNTLRLSRWYFASSPNCRPAITLADAWCLTVKATCGLRWGK
jgi:glucose/arabinose dehydrogenase